MVKPILEITGQHPEDTKQQPSRVVATIYSAEKSPDGHDFCRVSIPVLFDSEKFIFGVDAEQAQELAAVFARDLLAHSGIEIATEIKSTK